MNTRNDDGATPEPPKPTPMCGGVNRKHITQWVWEGQAWTNRVRCSTCGKEWVNDKANRESQGQ